VNSGFLPDKNSMETQQNFLQIAVDAAKIAAEPLKNASEGYRTIHMEDAHDVKLQADLESERKIRKFLNSRSPFPIIGEEQGGDSSLWNSDEYYWVVDPLDGTYNYLRECPHCCVSIGLMKGQSAQVGAIYDFNRDEIFTGGRGLEFQVNGVSHRPNWAETVDKACLTTGFPHEMKRDMASMQVFIQRLLNYKKVRMIGTAALAVTYVSTGYYDVYYETGIKLWDVAAGLAFAESVGATVKLTEWKNKPLHFDIWMAGKPEFILE
jgi:myo-inositol-1(or 4)-monophosphatase